MNLSYVYIHYQYENLRWMCQTYTCILNIHSPGMCHTHIHCQYTNPHAYTVNIQTYHQCAKHILHCGFTTPPWLSHIYSYTVSIRPHHKYVTHIYIHCKSCHTYKYIVNIKPHKEIPHIRKLSIYKPTMNVPHTYTCTVNIQPHHECATRIRTKSCDIQDPNKCWCVTRTERKTSVDTRHDVIKQFRVYRLRQCVATSSSLVWFQRDSIHKTNKNWRFERILPNPKKISGKRQLNKEVSKQNNSFGDISLGLKKIFFKRIKAELRASTRAQ